MEFLTKTYLSICFKLTDEFGYISNKAAYESNQDPTFYSAKMIYCCAVDDGGNQIDNEEKWRNLANNLGINAFYSLPDTTKAILWIKSLETENEYFNKVKTILSKSFINDNELPIVASVPASYRRYEQRQMEIENSTSEYVGNIGEKITVDVVKHKIVSYYEGDYGRVYIHRFDDKDGNVFIWKTATVFDDDDIKKVIGTVKQHNEFNGIKQTVLTRCKIM